MSCFSLVSLYSAYLRRIFLSSGLQPQTIHIDSETTLHCWIPATNSGFPSKPPLVLIHGFGPAVIWQWRYQVRSLSRHFSLYVPDLVFFGLSTTSSPERSDVFQAVSVAKMMEKLGVERFSVIGTSYGGFVAYHLGRLCGERVEKVVIASSGVNKRRRDNDDLKEKAGVERISNLLLPPTPRELRALIRLSVHRPPYLPDCLLNDVIKTLYKGKREEKIQLLIGVTLGKDDDVKISPLQQEVLIVWGDYDQIFPLEMAFELKRYLGEDVRLEVIKNTSHMPHVENPKRFNAIVNNFLLGFPN